jgi:ribose/xylose/arabinose/galactoside ABC-type transport system permease subunit
MTAPGKAARSTAATATIPSRLTRAFLTRPLIVIFIVSVILASLISPVFLSSRNVFNLLQQSSIDGIIAIGMTFVILGAGIDLSVGSVAAFGGMIVAILVTDMGVPTALAILVSLALGALIGLGQGLITALTKVPSFIITLGGLVAIRGLTYLLTDGKPVFNVPDDLRYLGAGFVGPVPVVGIIFIIVTIIAGLFLGRTRIGRYIYAAGGNPEAARLSGVPVAAVIAFTFVVSGTLAAFGGVLLTAWLDVGQPTASEGVELYAIAAVVLGGTSLFGGKGGVYGTFIAVILLTILRNILNLAGVSPYFQQILTGVVLVGTVLLNWAIARRAKPMA